jgi:phosphatidylglycerophosphate synthase
MNLTMDEIRDRGKKDYYMWFSKFMHHTLFYITKYLLRTNITPNQITVFWLCLQVVASVMMAFGIYKWTVIGVLLYTLAAILDYIDGQIARIKKISSYRGMFLEELGLYFGNPIFLMGLAIGTMRVTGNILYLYLGIISAISILYSQLAITDPMYYPESMRSKVLSIKEKLSTRSKSKIMANIMLIFRRSNPLNLLSVLIVLKMAPLAFFIYTPLYVIKMFRVLWVQLKILSKLDKEE